MKKIELTHKRKAREKHFLKANGEIEAYIYNEDIHFFKNGKYEEIDNSLIEQDNYYTNKNNAFRVYFKKDAQNDLMKIEAFDHYLNLELKESKKNIIKKRNK